MTWQLIMKNDNEENWQFNDKYEKFEDVIERVTKTLKCHKDDIKETTIYDLKSFQIKIYKIKNGG